MSGPRTIAGQPVGSVGLGGSAWSIRKTLDQRQVNQLVSVALDAGIVLFDTARAYTTVDTPAHNETILGRALTAARAHDRAFVVSKGGHYRVGPSDWRINASPQALRRDSEATLHALGRDHVDLYLLHHPDPNVPIEDSVLALADLKREGKVRSIGVSNVEATLLSRAQAVTEISAVQNRFSPFDTTGRALVDRCRRDGIAYLAYSSLGGKNRPTDLADRFPVTLRLAQDQGCSPYQLWLAWLRSISTTLLPLIGATTTAPIRDSAVVVDATLTRADLDTIEREITAFTPTPEGEAA